MTNVSQILANFSAIWRDMTVVCERNRVYISRRLSTMYERDRRGHVTVYSARHVTLMKLTRMNGLNPVNCHSIVTSQTDRQRDRQAYKDRRTGNERHAGASTLARRSIIIASSCTATWPRPTRHAALSDDYRLSQIRSTSAADEMYSTICVDN